MDLSNHTDFKVAPDEAIAALDWERDLSGKELYVAEILRLALECTDTGVWEQDLTTDMVRLSPRSLRMLGLPDNHSVVMTGEEWRKTVDARNSDQILLRAQVPGSSTGPSLQEFRVKRPDGEIRWLRMPARILPDREGRLTKLIGLQFDDTERKRAEEAFRENEARFRLVQEASLIGIVTGDDGQGSIGSTQYYRNLGLPEYTVSIDRKTQIDLIHPEDRERVLQKAESAIRSAADRLDQQYRIIRADTGEIRWIFARMQFERSSGGGLIRTVVAHLDITENKQAQAALQEAAALNQSMMEASADCVQLIGLDGRLQFINEQGLAALEIEDASRVLGKDWGGHLPRAERHKVEAALDAARNGQTGRFNAGCSTATGKFKWWDVVVTPIRDKPGQIQQILAISRDITEHRENLAQIRWAANHDILTELPNRRYFQERLEEVLACAAAQGSMVGLLQLDIDDFKQINDALGHDAGDALLKDFTQRLQNAVRGSEMVARLGGDEFAIIAPQLTDNRSLAAIVKDIHAQLAEPFIYQGHLFDCRASIGKAIYPEHGASAVALLKNADVALYVAKSSGRGNVRRFNPEMRSDMHARLDMVSQARTALKNDLIFPFYQPKVDFGTGLPAGFEALLRWQDRDMKIQPPGAIAAAFEDLDVAQMLSERIQLRVLADMRRWLDDGVDFGHVAINASAAEFRQNDFAERLLTRVKAAGVPTSYFELEVTETVFLGRGADYVDRALKLLSAEGVRISLDDFGTGYASLSHLKKFPVDVIKIDQSFVRNIEIDPDDSAIIKALIGLGKSLSIRIVAEGIENHAQSAFLAEHGCDYGQGYLFSKAVAATEVPELLSRLRQCAL